ncbi:MAG: DUF92 domain-containing protein [Caldilineales bacterium]|nr:DUF92 domain-containing protein [Caldilineales bacterium]MCW5858197.1 DUF92 domain-containing protein [Caldilineales bacterium]
MTLPLRLLLGLALAALIGWLSLKRGALSRSGAAGAALIGGLVFGLGGVVWGLVLIAFFLSSSLLSAFRRRAKAQVVREFAKGERRDLAQTLANGGLAALFAAGAGIVTPDSRWYPICFLAFLGALSAATADTWATEIGILSAQPPRLITTGRPAPAGASGGVTPLGLAASLAGGTFIGFCAYLLLILTSAPASWLLPAIGAIAGFIGAAFDSLLGATWQAAYYCPTCAKTTEQTVHHCGAPTRLVRGRRWLDNDLVNTFATLAGALVAVGLSAFLSSA